MLDEIVQGGGEIVDATAGQRQKRVWEMKDGEKITSEKCAIATCVFWLAG
jgi:hypothetical protein